MVKIFIPYGGRMMKTFLICMTILFAAMLPSGCTSTTGKNPRVDLLGDPATPSVATRTVVVGDDMQYVNVTGGETIKFVVGDKAFAWNFDSTQDLAPFNLKLIAPPGVAINHDVIVYVAPNPLYARPGGLPWSPWMP